MSNQQNLVMKTAQEGLEENARMRRLSTGNSDLDSLLGGIEEGSIYLLYGDQEVLDRIIHRLLVGCVLPREKGGFDSQGIYFNNTNYYKGKTILNPSYLGGLAKHLGIEPKIVLENLFIAAAYSEERQLVISREIADVVEENQEVRLIVAHNLTRFLRGTRDRKRAAEILKQVTNNLRTLSSLRKMSIIITGEANPTRTGFIPRPAGGNFFRHIASVIVHVSKLRDGRISTVKATLVKHPYKRTPKGTRLFMSRGGHDLMGRITPSFRQLYEDLLNDLRSKFQNSLIDLENREAFDLLIKEAWSGEQAAMGNSGVPVVLDSLNLVANLHNRKMIQYIIKKLERRDQLIEELQKRIETVETQASLRTATSET